MSLTFCILLFFNNCDLDHRSANKTVVVATIKSTSKLLIDKFVFDTI